MHRLTCPILAILSVSDGELTLDQADPEPVNRERFAAISGGLLGR